MGLYVIFSISDSQPPGLDGFSDHSLATAIINMDMPHRLFVSVGEAIQSFDCCPALCLRLQCQPQHALGGIKMAWEIQICPARHFSKNGVERQGLPNEHSSLR